MNYFTILAIAVVGIGATVYLVKAPLQQHNPQPVLDEYSVKLEKAKKNCNSAGGVLVVDADGKFACSLLKSRWPLQ